MADEILLKPSDLQGKTDEELSELLASTSSALFTSRFENHTNKLNDTARLRKLRRQVARIHTLVAQRRTKKNEGKSTHE